MRRSFLSVCLLVLSFLTAHAQTSATGIPYFQQHVHYTLDATLLDDARAPELSGMGSLVYVNHSPDTLHELYFHLYWNLFRNGSYGERAPNRDHREDQDYGRGGIDVTRWRVGGAGANGDATPDVQVDNTIARLVLPHALLPGDSTTIMFDWTGRLPNYGIRSTWGWHDAGARNFSTAQWYPQVCVYDNHGWHPDQYIGMGEFYTDYGAFDVTLHVPQRFSTVVSTGWQTNQDVLPAATRERLEFARTHPDSIVRIADHSDFHFTSISRTEPLAVWKFHADSVRDFAWCADEAYIWDAVYDNGIMHHALYWNNSREFWGREAARIALLTIQTNSRFAGQYVYPNAFMCETYEGGMEYPGIVYIGPYSSGSPWHWAQNTMMHELGHEWYPMMMGSNETDYGYMDEGFNTFITTFVHEAYFGRFNNSLAPGLGYNDDERTSNHRQALLYQLSGEQEPSKTKADMYHSYRSYATATYPHTSTVLFMLRYVMGDAAFDDFMHLYYTRWRFKHPYPDDLMNAAEDVERREGDTSRVRARGDLRWFFDEWFAKTWKLDYAIEDFDVRGNTASVRISRKERAVMPLDLVFTMEDGSHVQKWIAVDDWLRTVADERQYTYTFDRRPVHVEINPTNDLLDVNRLNNTSSWLPPLDVDLVPKIFGDAKPLDRYAVRSAPYIAPLDPGVRKWSFGWTLLGSYLDRSDKLALGVRFAPGANILGGVLQYHNVLDWLSPWTTSDVSFVARGAMMDNMRALSAMDYAGLRVAQVVSRAGHDEPRHIFNVGYDISGSILKDSALTPASESWTIPLNRVMGGYTYHYEGSTNDFTAAGQVEAGLGDPRITYSKLAATINDRQSLFAGWDAYLRVFGGSMQPITGSIPDRVQFHLATSSVIDHFVDLYTSNFGSDIRTKIRNAVESGPLVRGYFDNDVAGRVSGSASVELGNYSLFPFGLLREIPLVGSVFQPFGLTFFGDAGLVTDAFCTCNYKSELRYDAGVGLRLLGERSLLGRSSDFDADRTELQLDFPLWLSAPGSEAPWAFRFTAMVRQNF